MKKKRKTLKELLDYISPEEDIELFEHVRSSPYDADTYINTYNQVNLVQIVDKYADREVLATRSVNDCFRIYLSAPATVE